MVRREEGHIVGQRQLIALAEITGAVHGVKTIEPSNSETNIQTTQRRMSNDR